MKRIRLLAVLFCCVVFALPVTPALPAGAAEGDTSERLVIPEGTQALPSLFTEENKDVKEVVLPGTLKVIGREYPNPDGNPVPMAIDSLTIPHSVALIVENAFPEGLLLRVEAGSYAHRWAKANEHPFEIIEHAPSVGDYDADGLTTSTDARLLLQNVAGKVTFSDEQTAVADVDGDGDITTTDARLTLQYAVGKEAVESLACPLTFDSPLIPREAVEKVTGEIIEACNQSESIPSESLEPGYRYRRAPGPLKSPLAMVEYLNEAARTHYTARHIATIKGTTTGPRATIRGEGVYVVADYRLVCYGVTVNAFFDSRFTEFILE